MPQSGSRLHHVGFCWTGLVAGYRRMLIKLIKYFMRHSFLSLLGRLQLAEMAEFVM